MKQKTIGVVITHPPYGSESARQGLDMALAFAAFDQPVTVLFDGDGVLNLLADRHQGPAGIKAWINTVHELPHYDVQHLYVCAQACEKYSIDLAVIGIDVIALDGDSKKAMLNQLEQFWVF